MFGAIGQSEFRDGVPSAFNSPCPHRSDLPSTLGPAGQSLPNILHNQVCSFSTLSPVSQYERRNKYGQSITLPKSSRACNMIVQNTSPLLRYYKLDVRDNIPMRAPSDTVDVGNQICIPPIHPLVPSFKSQDIGDQLPSCPTLNTPTSFVPEMPPNKGKCKPSQIPQAGILNMSKHKLSAAETSLLKKGLSFVPTPPKISRPNY